MIGQRRPGKRAGPPPPPRRAGRLRGGCPRGRPRCADGGRGERSAGPQEGRQVPFRPSWAPPSRPALPQEPPVGDRPFLRPLPRERGPSGGSLACQAAPLFRPSPSPLQAMARGGCGRHQAGLPPVGGDFALPATPALESRSRRSLGGKGARRAPRAGREGAARRFRNGATCGEAFGAPPLPPRAALCTWAGAGGDPGVALRNDRSGP